MNRFLFVVTGESFRKGYLGVRILNLDEMYIQTQYIVRSHLDFIKYVKNTYPDLSIWLATNGKKKQDALKLADMAREGPTVTQQLICLLLIRDG